MNKVDDATEFLIGLLRSGPIDATGVRKWAEVHHSWASILRDSTGQEETPYYFRTGPGSWPGWPLGLAFT